MENLQNKKNIKKNIRKIILAIQIFTMLLIKVVRLLRREITDTVGPHPTSCTWDFHDFYRFSSWCAPEPVKK